jgi:integrase
MAKKLTDIAIRNLKPQADRYEIRDAASPVRVVVQPSGHKSFIVRYRSPLDGKPAKLTLQPGIGLAAARKEAADALYEVEKGRDPNKVKKAAKTKAAAAAADTVRAVSESYLSREGKRLRTIDQRRAAFERLIFPAVGDRPIGELKRSEINRLLDRIEDERGPRMADMTLAFLRRVLNWHAIRDDDFLSPIAHGMARTKPKERARSRVLTDDELRAVWKAAGEGKGPLPALLKFLLLTAARRSEAAEMMWAEIEGTDWMLPAARNKTKLDLVRPLSQAAQDLLAAQPQIDGCKYVFTTDGKHPLSGFSKFKRVFDKTCGVSGWTLHDLRRTARSLMSRAGVSSDHAERALGHVIGGVRGTYDRHEYHREKKLAFDALAALIRQIVDPKNNIISIAATAPRGCLTTILPG